MRQPINPLASRTLCVGLAATGLALAGVPASAQSVSEVTVTGHMGATAISAPCRRRWTMPIST